MITFWDRKAAANPRGSQPFCDGVSRRNFLRIGAAGIGASAVSLPQLLAADSARSRSDHSVVMVYLPGGPTQHETFDPKPNAPVEIRGSFAPMSTQVPGVQFCELLPKLGAIADKFAVIRSLVGMVNRHESFHTYTGRPGGRPGDGEPAGGWPTFGSTVSYLLGARSGVAPYVDAAPKMGHRPYNNMGVHDPATHSSWPGFTGRAHAPLTLDGDIKNDLKLNGIDLPRLETRRDLLQQLGELQQGLPDTGLTSYQQQAYGMLTSGRVAEALDLQKEDPKVIERYGQGQPTDPSFGGAPQSPQHFLRVRRLLQAGVRCATVAFGAWDWHANREGSIEYLSKKYLPVFDHTLAVFLEDLEQHGLLETTTVVVWGEFGRTPRINAKGGRDHWPGTQSVLMAGGGVQGGRVIGETDRVGGVPIERPVHLQEVFATLYDRLGIDVNTVKIPDLNGRPRYLVDNNRRPVQELL